MIMASYAYYRLPYDDHYTIMEQTSGEPERVDSCAGLDGCSGFVVAPFAVSADCPVLLVQPDRVECRPVPEDVCQTAGADVAGGQAGTTASNVLRVRADRESYSEDFADYHSRLASGEFRKIVLARSEDIETVEGVDAEVLFLRACRMYPRMFVVLVSTPVCGTWLAATPEVLLEGGGGRWHTIALAGTMELKDSQQGFDNPPLRQGDSSADGISWSTKNIKEQRYVATYIADRLARFSTDCHEEGPRTARAGNLVHLRSDFTFTLADGSHTGSLIETLHPTPAVCGLPKDETFRHIVTNEHTSRSYYSGFIGPLNHDGYTHLYVSLRCMQIVDPCHYRLFAGGGLLKDSVEAQEWCETEAKMETMKRLLTATE